MAKPTSGKKAPATDAAPEEVDYSTSGPDLAFHRKVSNACFCVAILGLLGLLGTLVFLDLRKAASGQHASSLGTAKGHR